MSTRITGVGVAMLAVLGAGCGSGLPTAISPRPSAAPVGLRASAAMPCGRPPAYSRTRGPAKVAEVSLPGTPDGIASTADGRAAFVALQSGPPRIAVLARSSSGERLVRTIPVPKYASGVHVAPTGKYVLAAAGRGAVVLDAAAAISGAGHPVLGSLSAPAGVVGSGPGAAEVAVSPDSRYAFVTLEGAGAVAVFDLRRGFGASPFIGAVPVGDGALGIAASPDGRWLYEVSESARAGGRRGTLNVISLSRAVHDPSAAVVARAPAPCAPVRVAISPDGATVWVTARDANTLLAFSAAALRSDPSRALLSATRVGEAPLGLALADAGRIILVADSDVAHAPSQHPGVSVVDASSPAHPVLSETLRTGRLADAIAVPSAGPPALVTASSSRQVDIEPVPIRGR
jgi:DNA-binding beta-propeller fold protein YncE